MNPNQASPSSRKKARTPRRGSAPLPQENQALNTLLNLSSPLLPNRAQHSTARLSHPPLPTYLPTYLPTPSSHPINPSAHRHTTRHEAQPSRAPAIPTRRAARAPEISPLWRQATNEPTRTFYQVADGARQAGDLTPVSMKKKKW